MTAFFSLSYTRGGTREALLLESDFNRTWDLPAIVVLWRRIISLILLIVLLSLTIMRSGQTVPRPQYMTTSCAIGNISCTPISSSLPLPA